MASSSYYYDLYKQYRNSAENYGKDIKSLQAIKSSLNSSFYDEQFNVNMQLEELKGELKSSVRHDVKFDSFRNSCDDNKEKTTSSDKDLSRALNELEQEIGELSRKKQSDEANADEYYRRYNETKEEERQELIKKLNIFK